VAGAAAVAGTAKDQAVETASRAGAGVGAAADAAGKAVEGAVDTAAAGASGAVETAGDLASQAGATISGAGAAAAGAAGGAAEAAGKAVEGAVDTAAAGVGGVVETAGDLAGQAGAAIAAAPAAVAGAAEAVVEGTGDLAESTVEQVVKEINATFSLEEIAKFKEKLEFVEGIGPVYAEKLRGAGVETVLDLLRQGATRKGRLELVETSGITGKLILEWVNHADLYRIKGVGSEYADLLEAAGVDTVVELAQRNPAKLLNAVVETNRAKQLVRREPVASQVEDWVAQAKTLPRVVQY